MPITREDLEPARSVRSRDDADAANARLTADAAAGVSNFPPEGDVRLTANIAAHLHAKLRHAAIERRTTAGEIIEQWIEELL